MKGCVRSLVVIVLPAGAPLEPASVSPSKVLKHDWFVEPCLEDRLQALEILDLMCKGIGPLGKAGGAGDEGGASDADGASACPAVCLSVSFSFSQSFLSSPMFMLCEIRVVGIVCCAPSQLPRAMTSLPAKATLRKKRSRTVSRLPIRRPRRNPAGSRGAGARRVRDV